MTSTFRETLYMFVGLAIIGSWFAINGIIGIVLGEIYPSITISSVLIFLVWMFEIGYSIMFTMNNGLVPEKLEMYILGEEY